MAQILDLTGKLPQNGKDSVYTTPEDGKSYDKVVAQNYLCSHEFADIPNAMQELVEKVGPGGELHLIEPSLEWGAREVLKGNIDVVRSFHLYGNKEHPFRSGCTLVMLRDLVSRLGLVPVVAGTQPYVIAVDDMKREYRGDQHYVVATRPNPEEASKSWVR